MEEPKEKVSKCELSNMRIDYAYGGGILQDVK